MRRATQFLRRLVSPVHFTTDAEGQVHQGLQHLPIGDGTRPVLFVGNHQVGLPHVCRVLHTFYVGAGSMHHA